MAVPDLASLAPELIDAWPRDTRFARRCFEQLKRAFVEARYSPAYEVSGEEPSRLVEQVISLRKLSRLSAPAQRRNNVIAL
ncbi:nucleotidyltransferase [Sinorhizobium meliloti]|uniref:nucleotidyltransferase n=1 Tax=Rhizobium meliloti TaxID=382 RepID=UPI001F2E740B|nr:nucleotidyltransferase [Sinorhizobium meliloti]